MAMTICERCKAPIIQHGFVIDDAPLCRSCNDDLRPACPYCSATLAKRPKAASKCRTCGKRLVVRTKQQHYPSTVLTQDQAVYVDFAQTMDELSLSREDWEDQVSVLRARFGKTPSNSDVAWGLLGVALFRAGRDPSAQLPVLSKQVQFLRCAKQNADHVLPTMHLCDLLSHRQCGVRTVKFHACDAECPGAAKLNLREMPIREAIEKVTIPMFGCTQSSRRGADCYCSFTISDDGMLTGAEAKAELERMLREDPRLGTITIRITDEQGRTIPES